MRFYYMAVIITGVLLLLNLAGVITPSGSIVNFSGLVDSSGNTTIETFKSSGLWGDSTTSNSLVFILGGFLVATLVLGAFGRAPDIRYTTAAFVLLLTGMLAGDLIWLFTYVRSLGVTWITNIISLLIGVSLIALITTAIQYWQGSD